MTMQRPELLRYRGRWYPILRDPLDKCTDRWIKLRMERLQMRSTALWRGYQGNWAVVRAQLWLTALLATVREHSSPDNWTHGERGLDWLFPGTSGPVLADWYTGELVTGMGNGARVHQFAWDWQRYRVFTLARGAVVRTEVRDNTKKFREGVADFERFTRMLDGL